MKQKILCFPLLLGFLLNLSACSGARKLPAGMDEAATGAAAQQIVALLNKAEYQMVSDAFRQDLREEYAVTPEAIRSIMETAAEAGSFVETEQTLVLGGSSKNFGEPYAAVAVSCKHEKKTVTYEVSLDTDLNLIGLQVKVR